jgi:hypothetical protein
MKNSIMKSTIHSKKASSRGDGKYEIPSFFTLKNQV